jgi:O-antigen/teichoic acid export membrane protein
MPDGLKSRTLSALFWSFLERFGQQGIQFVISIILAQLLLPEDFGLIAILTIFMAIAQSFMDSRFLQPAAVGASDIRAVSQPYH